MRTAFLTVLKYDKNHKEIVHIGINFINFENMKSVGWHDINIQWQIFFSGGKDLINASKLLLSNRGLFEDGPDSLH